MKLCTKYESSWPCSFREEDFWKLHFEIFDPVTYLCNQSQPISTILVGDYPATIYVVFGRIPFSVQDKKSFEVFLI